MNKFSILMIMKPSYFSMIIAVLVLLIILFVNFNPFSLDFSTTGFDEADEEKSSDDTTSSSISSSKSHRKEIDDDRQKIGANQQKESNKDSKPKLATTTTLLPTAPSSSDVPTFNSREEYETYRKKTLEKFDEIRSFGLSSTLRQQKKSSSSTQETTEDVVEEVMNANGTTSSNSSSTKAQRDMEIDQQLLSIINPPRSSFSNKLQNTFRHTPIQCPNFRHKVGKDADSKVSSEVIHKYTRYTSQFCNTTGMLQMFFGLKKYLFFLDVMAKIVNLKEGDRIFDLGSGCGTELNYYHLKYGTTGVGIDLTSDAIAHARSHFQENQTFCHLDATLLKYFPSESFDVVMSWAVLYHIRRTWIQCAIVTELARMLKPGGVALLAQIRTEKTQLFWKKGRCQIEGASWRRLQDASVFREKSFKRNGFFSIYLKKHEKKSSNSSSNKEATKAAVTGEPTNFVGGGGGDE